MDSGQHQEVEKDWDWSLCEYDIKKVTDQTETIWNLKSSIQLSIPNENGAPTKPIVAMRIEMSRNFIFTESIGWNWHKSWNMPDIVCELDIRDPQTNERLVPPEKIHAELQVIKTVVNPTQTFHLYDVGVKGNSRADMENGKCVFSGLKFDSTSYNHEHSKFHLVITMYLTQNKFEFNQILESRISPPIFIDSRKSARDISKQKGQKIQSYLDPFLPETLEKSFTKRDSKIKFSNEEEISSNIDGLVNYFSAPNIRHKVKHPLFLAIKFYQCISLYINTNRINYDSEERIIEAIQTILFESYQQNQGAIMKIRLENKPLIIGVDTMQGGRPAQKQKKILEFLEPLKNDIIEIMIDPVGVPKCFQKLNKINELTTTYKKIYQRLVNMKFKLATVKQHHEIPTIDVKTKVQANSEPEENLEKIRKTIKVQGGAEEDDYLNQIRNQRGATMNAKLSINQKPEVEQPAAPVKVEEAIAQPIVAPGLNSQSKPLLQTLPQPMSYAQQALLSQQEQERNHPYNQLLQQFASGPSQQQQNILLQQRQFQEYIQMQYRMQMYQQQQQQQQQHQLQHQQQPSAPQPQTQQKQPQ